MNDLLQLPSKPTADWAQWHALHSLEARLSIDGDLWRVKGVPEMLRDIRMDVLLHWQQSTTHFAGQDKRIGFTPDEVALRTETGDLLGVRDNPRASFQAKFASTN